MLIPRAFIIVTILSLLCLPISVYSEPLEDGVEKPDRYILIHLDGVSSHYLLQELKAGNLPNIEAVFRPHGLIERAITYLPSKTPVVIANVQEARQIEESELVSWTGVNSDTGESFSGGSTLNQMLLSKSRLSVTNILYGAPLLYHLNILALDNLPDLLDEYRVLQYYWYPVDTFGHFYGEESYLEKLRAFDHQIGKLAGRIDDQVNLVIYSDHGMAFGEGVFTDDEIEEVLGDRLLAVSYPNVYIRNPDQAGLLAKNIQRETRIDFTFYRSGEQTITGFHKEGEVRITKIADGYQYQHDGTDPFGFEQAGYDGSPLSAADWLKTTYDMAYPVAPSHLYKLLSNPASGQILTLLDHGKYSRTTYSDQGNHGGFTDRELTIPILLKGPNLETLYDRRTMDLRELFLEISDIRFGYNPRRDRHYISSWHHFRNREKTVQLSVSPAYRWAVGTEVIFTDLADLQRFNGWVKFDLFRSYLARFWVGSGVDIDETSRLRPLFFLRHELRYRRLTARSTLSTNGNHRFALEYTLTGPVSLHLTNFNSAGVRLEL